jgi:hypothetical protein
MNQDNTGAGKETWEAGDHRRHNGRIGTGFFLLLIGSVLFLRTSGLVLFPSWFFSWGTFCIALGLFMAAKHRLRSGFWIFFILIGAFSIMDDINPRLNMDKYLWPVILMCVGAAFILRPKKSSWRRCYRQERRSRRLGAMRGGYEAFEQAPDGPDTTDRRDYIDVTAVFGGVKKRYSPKASKAERSRASWVARRSTCPRLTSPALSPSM